MVLKLLANAVIRVPFAMVLLLMSTALPMAAEESPIAGFKDDLHRALVIHYDPALQAPERIGKQKQQIWDLVDAAFDEDLIIPRVLERTWPALTPEEKALLLPAASWAIKWKFIGKLYKYNVREITFNEEGIGSGQYLLKARLGVGRFTHPSEFLFLKKDGCWVAVDIRIRGASLAGHYRRKFDGTYFEVGLNGLLRQLEGEVKEEFEEMGFGP
jgi:ABC-type transporter MlaC component